MSLSGEEPTAAMSLSGEEPTAAMSLSGEEPKVSRARAALTVVVGLAAAGAVVGALWTWLAPPIHGVVALTRSGDRIKASLGSESDHWFTSAFLIVGMLAVLAVVAAVLVWQWRAHRGPVMVAALAVGGVAAGPRRQGRAPSVRACGTGPSTWRRHRCPNSIGCTTSWKRPPCSSATRRCRSPRRCCFPLRSRRWSTCCPPRRPRGTISAPGRRSSTRCCLLVELGLLVKPREGLTFHPSPRHHLRRDHAERQHAPVG